MCFVLLYYFPIILNYWTRAPAIAQLALHSRLLKKSMFTPTVQKYLAILTALKGARSVPIANLMLRNFGTPLSLMLTLNVVERTSHGIDVQHVLYTDCGMVWSTFLSASPSLRKRLV